MRTHASQRNKSAAAGLLLLGVWLAVSACDEQTDDSPDKPALDSGVNPVFTDAGNTADGQAAAAGEVAGADGIEPEPNDVNVKADVAQGKLSEVALIHEGEPELELATAASLAVLLETTSGTKGSPGENSTPQVLIDGLEVGSKGWVAAAGDKQPAVALWPTDSPGTWRVVGVRAGTASVQLRYGAVTSNAVAFSVVWPAKPAIRVIVPGANGLTTAEREIDVANTIKLGGETIGGGGLDVTIRFPATAKAGDRYDMQVKPAAGGLSISAELADLPGAKHVLAKGVMWVDQVDNGLFRGSFHGLAASLKPMAGAFMVERKGLFGVDVLGAALQVGKSDNLLPESGMHHSRATLHAVPGGKAMLIYRVIENKTKARLVRILIDPISGKLDTSLPPLVDGANAYTGTPDVFAPAFGKVASARSAGKQLFVWEGRDGKGSKKPHQLWGQVYDDKYQAYGPAVLLSDDACNGNCKPEVHALPASRWLVVWTGPNGGVRSRRVSGNLVDGKASLPSPDAETLAAKGDGASAATWEANVLMGWRDPVMGLVWRMYNYSPSDDKLKATLAATSFGAKAVVSPYPALVAVEAPSAPPNLLFAGAWLEGLAPGGLSIRRIAVDGTALGVDLALGASAADRLLAVTGKLGQVALLERVDASKQGPVGVSIRVRKSRYQSLGDGGEVLGGVVDMAPPTGDWLGVPTLCYVAEVDAYVMAWSGDHASAGVWIRRFR